MKTLKNYLIQAISLKFLLIVIVMMSLAACSKDGGEELSDPEPEPNTIQADAGQDRNVLVNQQVDVNGNATGRFDAASVEYNWKFLTKPAQSVAELSDEAVKNPSFSPDLPGKYNLLLTVSTTVSDTDTLTIWAFDVDDVSGTYMSLIPGSDVGIRDFGLYKDLLIATCEFSEIGGVEAKKIASYDGNQWAAMGCGLEEGSIYDLLEYKDELYATGNFEEIGCIPANNIARWDGTQWKAVGGGLTGGDDPTGYTLSIYEGELYVGGLFTMAGNVDVRNIAKWDGTAWSAAGMFGDGSVRKLHVYKQKLYAGGYFSSVNGLETPQIAAYNGSGWEALGSAHNLENQATGVVTEMAVFQDELYISGVFFDANDNPYSEISAWDGFTFRDFGKAFSLSRNNLIYEMVTIDEALYIGGNFPNAVGSSLNNIVLWNGEGWGKMASGVEGSVLAIIQYESGIYVGGEYSMAGGISSENISIWMPD